MKISETEIPGVLIFEPKVFEDDRGFFLETWRKDKYAEAGVKEDFVQDNVSFSMRGTLRGLHFQNPHGQGKLVQVLTGHIFDVAVDIRVGSPSFGKWVGIELSGEDRRQIYIPPGFAHGFCVMSETALFSYKCTDYYAAECDSGIVWNDPDIGIEWPIADPVLSKKDAENPRLSQVTEKNLPTYNG